MAYGTEDINEDLPNVGSLNKIHSSDKAVTQKKHTLRIKVNQTQLTHTFAVPHSK